MKTAQTRKLVVPSVHKSGTWRLVVPTTQKYEK